MTAPRARKTRESAPLDGPWELAYDRMMAKRRAADAALQKKTKPARRPKSPTAG